MYDLYLLCQALQLNTLDFEAACKSDAKVRNAAWVYESELYTVQGGKVVVDPEALGILHDIISSMST